ncbi:P-loop containing nucleoside triphosphate hydrolase protein [Nemania abortiva]|nr:P-loop containing nucleoside triphosphate hydrolase protein [Nemania abortiva]
MDQNARHHEDIFAVETQDSSRHSTTAVPDQKATYRLLEWKENPLFFGRDDGLGILSRELLDPTDEQLRIFAIVGMAGVGKSQLALHFVYRHCEKLDGIFWIPADEPTKLARGFGDIAKELRLFDDTAAVPNETVRQDVLSWLQTTTKSWLLVLDNLQDMRILQDYWPIGSKGRIIITSRNPTAMEKPVTASKLIEPFNPEDGAAAFLSFLPENVRNEPDARSNACTISSACGGHPLALHQCASLLKVKNLSIKDLSLICSDTASFVQPDSLLNTIPGDEYYCVNLSTTWQKPLATLPENSIFMLRLLSWFDPDSIPEVLMESDRELHEGLRKHLVDEASYNLVIKSLREQGLVYKGTNEVLIMHKLVQTTVIQSTTAEDRRAIFQLTLALLDAAIPPQTDWEQQTGKWDQYDRALPHIQRLESLRRELKIEPEPGLAHQLGSVLERVGWYLCERRLLDESLDFLSKAESIAKNAAATPNLDRAVSELLNGLIYDVINDKACIKFAECHFKEAKDLYTECLALKAAMDSPSQNELCLLTGNIGNALANMGLLDEAYDWLNKSLEMRQTLVASALDVGRYRDQLARDWGTLAGCLWLRGDYLTASEYADRSTELCKEIYAEDDIVLAGCYTTLGNIRKSQGMKNESKKLHLKSLDIYQKKYSSHYDTALAFHRYGKILEEEKNIRGAIDNVKRAIEILSDNPCFKAANARSHYFLAKLLGKLPDDDGTQDLEIALLLYSEHVGVSLETAKGSNLSMEDFDKLISCWHW